MVRHGASYNIYEIYEIYKIYKIYVSYVSYVSYVIYVAYLHRKNSYEVHSRGGAGIEDMDAMDVS